MSSEQLLLILGADESEYGRYREESLGQAVVCLSVGADNSSPSMAYKADLEQPNEDALMVIRKGARYFMAVADGHFGNQASHSLIKRLSEEPIPKDKDGLLETVTRIQRPELNHGSGSTLTVAVWDEECRRGFGVSTGDSSLVTLSAQQFFHHAPPNNSYFYFQRPLKPEDWEAFEFEAGPGGLILLYTDGINECHYRKPETSIQDSHILTLWQHMEGNAHNFAVNLTKLALEGVSGNPGGQDNIALIALKV